jgi:hypothetical protein
MPLCWMVSMAAEPTKARRRPTSTTRPVTGGYISSPDRRQTTSPNRPISAPAWLRTGPPIVPASETMVSLTARLARRRWLRWRRRAPPSGVWWSPDRCVAVEGMPEPPPSGGSGAWRVGRRGRRASRRAMGRLGHGGGPPARPTAGHVGDAAPGGVRWDIGRIRRSGGDLPSVAAPRARRPCGRRRLSERRREVVLTILRYWGVLPVSSATPPRCSSSAP